MMLGSFWLCFVYDAGEFLIVFCLWCWGVFDCVLFMMLGSFRLCFVYDAGEFLIVFCLWCWGVLDCVLFMMLGSFWLSFGYDKVKIWIYFSYCTMKIWISCWLQCSDSMNCFSLMQVRFGLACGYDRVQSDSWVWVFCRKLLLLSLV